VRRLTESLPRHVDIWLDADELRLGQKFPQHIERGIRLECDFVIVFVDRHALESPWVKREVALALQRGRDLQRSFVVPVMIDDVAPRLAELGLDAREFIYLDARDGSDPGIEASAKALEAELFKLASKMVEHLRGADRRRLLERFSAEVAEFEQVAFRWLASMSNSLAVLSIEGPAVAHARECLAAYNEVGDRFIPRLSIHRDELAAGWRESKALRNHINKLIDFVEDEVYRGTMFRMNEVLEMAHSIGAAIDTSRPVDAASIASQDTQKDEIIAAARQSLKRMTEETSELIDDLTSELEG
jgi:thioesterase domain-containing protein